MTSQPARGRAFQVSPILVQVLAIVLIAIVFVSGWSPFNRADWLLENVLVLITLPALFWAYRRQMLSTASYLMIFVFLAFHELGAHYTYSEVPYERWFEDLGQWSLNQTMGWERNQFDRLIHLLFGLLWFVPIEQVLTCSVRLPRIWNAGFSVTIIIAASTVYELIEWAAAAAFGGELGMAYLGTQGDVWDAHKDIALAIAGSLLAWLIVRVVR